VHFPNDSALQARSSSCRRFDDVQIALAAEEEGCSGVH